LMQEVVAEQIADFVKYPPRQKAASFNLDAVMRTLSAARSDTNGKAPSGNGTGSIVKVSVDVTNMGTVKGDEIVLLFASFPMVSKQLKGFARVTVDAGKTVTATIPLRISDLKYWDGSWKYPSGAVKIMVGSSSADEDLISDSLMVK